jgi:molybdopterin-guanine dinucleotide biosynthesis protein A
MSERLPGKHLADICGERMIERIARIADESALFDEVLIMTRDGSIRPKNVRTVVDHSQGTLINSIIESIRQFGAFFALAGDMPLIDSKLLKDVFNAYSDKPVAAITSTGIIEPLFAIYNSGILKGIIKYSKESSAIHPFIEENFSLYEVQQMDDWKLTDVNVEEDLNMVRKILRCP